MIENELLSAAILEFIRDMDAAIAAGYEIDQSEWYSEKEGQPCTVCLGGAALLGTNFNLKGLPNWIAAVKEPYHMVLVTGNLLRKKHYSLALNIWTHHKEIDINLAYELYELESYHDGFEGKMSPLMLKVLRHQLTAVSETLKKYGY